MLLFRLFFTAALTIATFSVQADTPPESLIGTWIADGGSPWTEASYAGYRLILQANGRAIQIRDGKRITMEYKVREPNLLDLMDDSGHDSARFFVSEDSLMLIIGGGHTLEFSRGP